MLSFSFLLPKITKCILGESIFVRIIIISSSSSYSSRSSIVITLCFCFAPTKFLTVKV